MTLPEIVERDEWLEARRALLEEEKALTRARDALSTKRRELPMVEVTTPYRFTGPDGGATLLDLFDGYRQLLVSHFMFQPEWEDGCPSCSAGADEVAPGLIDHLHTRDTHLVFVSVAPIEKIEDYKHRKGWTFPWFSSSGSDFNLDFGVTIDESKGANTFNYRDRAEMEERGEAEAFFDVADQPFEMPGMSVFLRDGDRVFHTYSSYARGAEWAGGSYAYLDLTALGRQEDWERPEGRADEARTNQPDFAS